MADSSELDRLRAVQRQCAAAAIALTRRMEACLIPGDERCKSADVVKTEREREYAMLGVNDYLVEELILLYWMDAIGGKLSAISGQQSAALAES